MYRLLFTIKTDLNVIFCLYVELILLNKKYMIWNNVPWRHSFSCVTSLRIRSTAKRFLQVVFYVTISIYPSFHFDGLYDAFYSSSGISLTVCLRTIAIHTYLLAGYFQFDLLHVAKWLNGFANIDHSNFHQICFPRKMFVYFDFAVHSKHASWKMIEFDKQ